MGSEKAKLKTGMGGSNGGRNRWAKTEVLKSNSKKRRRIESKNEIEEQQNDTNV